MADSKWALVTGASGGVGKEIAGIMAKKNWNLVLVARSADKLKELASQLNKDYGVQIKECPADLSKDNAAHEIFDFCKAQNVKIDLLINNPPQNYRGGFFVRSVQANTSAGIKVDRAALKKATTVGELYNLLQ